MEARRTGAIVAGAVAMMVACSRPTATPAGAEASAEADAGAGAEASADAGADADADASADAGSGAEGRGGEGGAATAADAGAARARVVKIDEGSAGKTIELAPGQTLAAMLSANPSTGFDWAVIKAPAALGAPEMGFVPGGEQPGAPGKRRITWSLKTALPAGEQAVELGYARSFEKGVAPFKTFTFKVRAAAAAAVH